VVGNGRPADGAEVDGVEVLQLVEAVLVHHPAVLGVVVGTPGELLPGEGEAAAGGVGEGVEDGAAGRDDLDTDSVGGDGGDAERALGGHGGLRGDDYWGRHRGNARHVPGVQHGSSIDSIAPTYRCPSPAAVPCAARYRSTQATKA
jgi:hypothetical protein